MLKYLYRTCWNKSTGSLRTLSAGSYRISLLSSPSIASSTSMSGRDFHRPSIDFNLSSFASLHWDANRVFSFPRPLKLCLSARSSQKRYLISCPPPPRVVGAGIRWVNNKLLDWKIVGWRNWKGYFVFEISFLVDKSATIVGWKALGCECEDWESAELKKKKNVISWFINSDWVWTNP